MTTNFLNQGRLTSISTQLSFKEERIKIGMEKRDFKLCDQLSDEVDIFQKKGGESVRLQLKLS